MSRCRNQSMAPGRRRAASQPLSRERSYAARDYHYRAPRAKGTVPRNAIPKPGYCLDCRRLFAVSLTVLMLERGRDYSSIRMAPLRCPGCGGRHTQYSIIAPSKGGKDTHIPRLSSQPS
jgi:hypothetical protein